MTTETMKMLNALNKGLLSTALTRMNMRDSLIGKQFVTNMLIPLVNEAAMVDQDEVVQQVAEDVRIAYGYAEQPESTRKPFVYQDGIAIIPVHGILLNRFSYSWGFVTGYNFVRAQMNAALEDDDVQLIVYDVDSPGGEAVGCFELAAEIRESRATKPSLAVVDALAASGGYALASSATRMVCTPSGSVGSIGVYILWIGVSKAMEKFGIEAKFISEGDWKTAGNPYEPLSKEVQDDLQASVHKRAEEFYALVAENRGITVDAVREMQSRVFRADEALALGLIDDVQTPKNAVNLFLAELGNEEPDLEEEEPMANETATGQTEISSEQRAEIEKSAATAATTRIGAILTSPEAKGRENLANHFAFKTSMSAEDSIAALAASPKAEAEKPAEGGDDKGGDGKPAEGSDDKGGDDKGKGADGEQSRFVQAMNETGGAGVSGGGSGGDGEQGGDRVTQILGAQKTATGVVHRKVA